MEVCSRSAEETMALGARIAGVLRRGDVVVLSGDLGAGKTVLAKGIAAGLGVTEPVVSPTFTIVREYEGDVPLQHLDVYRLDHLQEVIDLGLDELLDGHAVTLVEWGEAVTALLPRDRLEVVLMVPPPEEADDDTRVIELHGTGPSWAARSRALTEALGHRDEGSLA
ncbi:MAG: tRNA (adenosine(37)-N6)-threonylcarbamoyltransferase complex ATPase subunit type 1 TsaE [Acidimicrobiia bacterium]